MKKIKDFLIRQKSRKRFVPVVSVAGVLLSLGILHGLLLPASTVEKETACGYSYEHTHDDSCYEKTLVCGMEETDGGKVLSCDVPVHEHDKSCYDGDKNLICGYADYTIHKHDKNCYIDGKLACKFKEAEEHKHGDVCYETKKTLTCSLPETEGHKHGDSCYEQKLACENADPEHTHDESCYEKNLVCKEEETEGHKHNEDCYKTEKVLTCKKPEVEEHIHTQDCFDVKDHEHTDSCKNQEGILVCGGLSCKKLEVRKHQHSSSCLKEQKAHKHSEKCYENKLICTKQEHTHTKSCYSKSTFTKLTQEVPGADLPICGKQEHTHDPKTCYNKDGEIVCGKKVHIHTADCYGISTMSLTDDEMEQAGLSEFLKNVTVKDASGNVVAQGGSLYVGEHYTIHLEFQEKGAQKKQFQWTEDGKMVYQIPPNFHVSEKMGENLYVTIDDQKIEIGAWSIDENGLLTVQLTEEGKDVLANSTSIMLSFDVDATAEPNSGGTDDDIHFGESGGDFGYTMTNQPKLTPKKTSSYDSTNELIHYTVNTKVDHGPVQDIVVKDSLTLPQSDIVTVEMMDGIDVKVKLSTGDIVTLTKDDYDLIPTESDPKNPYAPQTFEVRLKEGSHYNPLNTGDELIMAYQYKAHFYESGGKTGRYWANVANEATVTGTMPVEDPDTGETKDVTTTEKYGNSQEIFKDPPGHGIVYKDQKYSERYHTLHYTLYTVIPKGSWSPLYILDDTYVEYDNNRWYLSEFLKDGGRVSNLKVKAADVKNWPSGMGGTDFDRLNSFEELKKDAVELKGFNFEDDLPSKGYDPNDVNQYVYMYGGSTLNIIFGLDGPKWEDWNEWGHGTYPEDRLIITEYDLNLSKDFGDTITLKNMQDQNNTLELSPDDVLHAGVTNNVSLRFGGYCPGNSVFFNNVEIMNKTGTFDKSTNTIEYNVRMNMADSTVQEYFNSVLKDYIEKGLQYGWDYWKTMQAHFYDELPEGWEYVKGSLYATTIDKWNKVSVWDDLSTMEQTKIGPLDADGNIYAPIAYFRCPTDDAAELTNKLGGTGVKELVFTYKLKATDEWIRKHATTMEDIVVVNHAAIKDNDSKDPHWEASCETPYFPARLTKTAKQVGNSNLLQFELLVNPSGIDLLPTEDRLIVMDNSENLQIQTDSIKVLNVDREEVDFTLLPSENEKQFKLRVPDGMVLIIQYNALIPQTGKNVVVSNSACIDGVIKSDSGYEESLQVDNMSGGGEGSVYELTIHKTDSKDNSKQLPGAKFKYYIVLDDDSDLTQTGTINGHRVHTENSWNFETGENGSFKISKDMSWNLEPGNYYILEEVEAPKGYQKSKAFITFYYGAQNEMDLKKFPDAVVAMPNGTLTISNNPASIELPETGGQGTLNTIAGAALFVTGVFWLLYRNRRKKEPAKPSI